MDPGTQQTGRLRSGDVTLFYRRFRGPRARAPLLVFHGANYYDSADWVEVASALGRDREVLAWDARGFGESGWSPAKDYSYDAYLGDARHLMDHFGWPTAALLGHSVGGSYALVFAARLPARAAALVLVDHCPQPGAARGAGSPGRARRVYPSVAAALADSSREPAAPGTPPWSSFESRLERMDGGYAMRRDPDYANRTPPIAGWRPRFAVADLWDELARVQCPALVVRGTRSDRFTPEALARLAKDHPGVQVAALECGHDVAAAAPLALIETTRRFLDANGV